MGTEGDASEHLGYLVDRIHTTVLATIGRDGYPHTCAADMMYRDESGIYFLTARGKDLYRRLTENPHISLTGIKGDDTMSSVALSLVGDVVEVGPGYLDVLLKENPYMLDIYPTEASRSALTVFRIHRGSGEWFDLSKKPIERAEFSFGDFCSGDSEYVISGSYAGCGTCLEVCPQSCIDDTAVPFGIRYENCLRCGNCASICPKGAVSSGGMR